MYNRHLRVLVGVASLPPSIPPSETTLDQYKQAKLRKHLQHSVSTPISPILKIQNLSLGMLILRQKSSQFCTPRLKTPQPVLPYSGCSLKKVSTLLTLVRFFYESAVR